MTSAGRKAYVYILKCCDDSFYCGATFDVEKRIAVHRKGNGSGSRYVYSRLPVELYHTWEFDVLQQALAFEYFFKQLNRKQKLDIIENSKKHLIDEDIAALRNKYGKKSYEAKKSKAEGFVLLQKRIGKEKKSKTS